MHLIILHVSYVEYTGYNSYNFHISIIITIITFYMLYVEHYNFHIISVRIITCVMNTIQLYMQKNYYIVSSNIRAKYD